MKSFMQQPPRRLRWYLLALAALLGVPFVLPVVYLIGPLDGARPIDYITAWVYAASTVAVCLCLCVPSETLLAFFPERFPRPLRRLGSVALGQTVGSWLLAISMLAILAAGLTLQGSARALGQRAVWVKLALDAPPSSPPSIWLRYGSAPDASVPFRWQPYDESIVAVRRADSQKEPLRVLAVETDQGPITLDHITIQPEGHDPSGLIIAQPGGALLSWTQPSRAFTLTLAPGNGQAEVMWFDQRTIVELGTQPIQVVQRLPATYQGWAMLPAQEVRGLTLELDPSLASVDIRQINVLSDIPQQWAGANGVNWTAQDCTLQAGNAALTVNMLSGMPCLLSLPNISPINVPTHNPLPVKWAVITLLLLAFLVAFTFLVRWGQDFFARFESVENRLGMWQRQQTHHWSIAKIMWIVWLLSLVFHLIYALSVPIDYTNDSLNYYDFAHYLLQSIRFATISSDRTPGYPAFIAFIIAFFGDTALGIVVIQHLLLSFIAPLTVWALAPRVSHVTATIAGFCAAFLPAVSINANIIHTEALFTFCMMAALLIYVRYGERLHALLVIGILIGMATMVRPASIVLMLAFLTWLLLWGWCSSPTKGKQRVALLGCIALIAGYCVTAGPWQLHLALVRSTADMSNGRSNYAFWEAAVYQQRVGPELAAVRPDRAVWEVPESWYNQPYVLLAQHPSIITGSGDFLKGRYYYTEAVAEANQANPGRLRTTQELAALYNLTLRWTGDSSYYYWSDLSTWFLERWKTPPQQPPTSIQPVDTTDINQLMPLITFRWFPATSPARTFCINLSLFVLHQWIWFAIPSLLGVVVLVGNEQLRYLMPCWIYWIGLILTPALIGMPADRYVVVAEPLLYILTITSLVALVSVRYRRKDRSISLAEKMVSDAVHT